jgi:hypothetical protein
MNGSYSTILLKSHLEDKEINGMIILKISTKTRMVLKADLEQGAGRGKKLSTIRGFKYCSCAKLF